MIPFIYPHALCFVMIWSYSCSCLHSLYLISISIPRGQSYSINYYSLEHMLDHSIFSDWSIYPSTVLDMLVLILSSDTAHFPPRCSVLLLPDWPCRICYLFTSFFGVRSLSIAFLADLFFDIMCSQIDHTLVKEGQM